mgnify:CR=1 FL=1
MKTIKVTQHENQRLKHSINQKKIQLQNQTHSFIR